MKNKKLMSKINDKKYTVVRIDRNEFELEDGSIYPIPFELEETLSIEEFQKFIDSSKNFMINLLKEINGKTTNN